MADVYAIFGTLLALGIAFPGMLTAWWLLFPAVVSRASQRLAERPGRSVGLGLLSALALGIPITILLALPFGPAKFLGGVLLLGALAFASLGAAGMAEAMAGVLQEKLDVETSSLGAFLRSAVALELAAAFPALGWFLFLPVALVASLGAAVQGALNRSGREQPTAAADVERELVHEPQSA